MITAHTKRRLASKRHQSMGWLSFGIGMAMLGLESQEVIAMRIAKVSRGGPSAANECWTMVSEKVIAAAEIQMRGLLPEAALAHYRQKVRANRRKLLAGR